jgi:hypothetical protein
MRIVEMADCAGRTNTILGFSKCLLDHGKDNQCRLANREIKIKKRSVVEGRS